MTIQSLEISQYEDIYYNYIEPSIIKDGNNTKLLKSIRK